MGPPSTPILSALILCIIIAAHSPVPGSSFSSPPTSPLQRDRPNAKSPPSSSSSQFTPPPPPTSKSHGQTEGPHHHHSPPPPWPNKSNPLRRPGGGVNHNREVKKAARSKVNLGKKIGLLFIVIAASLQVAVAAFLGFKVWRVTKVKERGTGSSA